ncbi:MULTISPECIES: DUF309 domain-containing protein [unclassified Streptomyces]|uniref:DUF309 domain-containing protein n=1 Tax=unclassified Streptomyces TaxID=2593676 RepID=UPI000BF87914|nr:DUF309 domain-containing protein [Streptomyces sp. Ru87]PGH47620.1 hypothetical protein CRI70_27555 [Streptomyces sp. Ru87]
MREGPDPSVCENCGSRRGDEGPPAAVRRDRDEEGRARNARPRDGLGRPLPYGAEGVERQPEGIVRTPGQTLDEAQQLLDEGKPFHAHEVFEDAWKSSSSDADRALWRAMAQLAVGLTHAARGNLRGAGSLLLRAADGVEPYAARPPYGIDAAGLVAWARALESGLTGDADLSPDRLAPRLRAREAEDPTVAEDPAGPGR